ncbi:MAG: 3-hydroxyacyl-CoA dehydrogenase family protein [Desulfobacteraceae bacterium]|nr:MAG: 3-hydroxyacyl-CoA dehydrogenase family protein [Desulfobacteraceae bacterium]
MKPDEIQKVTVLGSGTMGPGMAQVFAQSRYPVTVWSKVPEEHEQGKRVIRTSLETFVRHGVLDRAEVEPAMERVTFTTDLEAAVENADLIIECIVENLTAKGDLFRQIDPLCREDALIASNTSFLNIFKVTPERRRAQTVIAHWFAPPQILPLVEVVRGPETGDDAVNTTVELLRKIGKMPIVIQKFVPGFAINRIQRIVGREVFFLLDNGYITPDQLDLAVKASLAPRMMVLGLVQRYDFTGLDLSARNLENADFLEPPLDNHPKSLFDLVEKGDLGVKTGRGFYDYSGRKLEEILKERDEKLMEVLKSLRDLIS